VLVFVTKLATAEFFDGRPPGVALLAAELNFATHVGPSVA
jgi:hypothetical protein